MRVLYFAWVREAIGAGDEQVAVPLEVTTISALIDWLSTRSDGHAAAFARPERLRAAIDGVFQPLDASIAGAAEVAIFPPVTGG